MYPLREKEGGGRKQARETSGCLTLQFLAPLSLDDGVSFPNNKLK